MVDINLVFYKNVMCDRNVTYDSYLSVGLCTTVILMLFLAWPFQVASRTFNSNVNCRIYILIK